MAKSVPRRHLGAAIVVVVLVLLAAAVGGWNVYQKRAIREEKARFAQAEQDIDKLSADIIAVTGQPLKVEKKKFCSRPSMKYQEGPLSCDINSLYLYAVEDPTKATLYFGQISSKIQSIWELQKTDLTNQMNGTKQFQEPVYDSADAFDGAQRILETYKPQDGVFDCKTTYFYFLDDRPPFDEYRVESPTNETLAITLSCGGDALIEHYPLNS